MEGRKQVSALEGQRRPSLYLQIDPDPIWVVKCDSDHLGDCRLVHSEEKHRRQDPSLMQ